jgi:tyrosyl-tRNA synthetase
MAEVNVYDELEWRGLIHQTTSPEMREILGKEKVTCYIGFDPSADSLHVGSLLQILLLVRMQQAGHRPIALLGGATGMIGDPSGKSEERNLLDVERVEHNLAGIRAQLEQFIDTSPGEHQAKILNNADWLGALSLLEFLRETGKCFSVNAMMDKDSVRTRLTEREQGISFTEFTYMLLQAHDFLHLFDHHGCNLQLGGSDQWGNVTAGVDLIRRQRSGRAFGITSPLLTTADGKKLGKTEKGAVWLDARKTSPYQFYQYWIRTEDADVIKMLRMLTMRTRDEVAALEKSLVEAPHLREAQRTLAEDMTTLVHGAEATVEAVKASTALFGQSIAELGERTLLEVMSEAPSAEEPASSFEGEGMELVELLARVGLCKSKGAARKDLTGGGIYLNNLRVQDAAHRVRASDALAERYLVLRKGKKNFFLVKLIR